jgi:hypothetical protein
LKRLQKAADKGIYEEIVYPLAASSDLSFGKR